MTTSPRLPDMLDARLQPLLSFAAAHGDYAEQLRSNNAMEQQRKRDGSVVTLADHAISHAAMLELPAIINAPVISEEQHTPAKDHPRFWLIDPIDGTSSYTGHYDGYAIAIAFIENGRPLLSVVMAPARQLAYVAASGQGAWRVDFTRDCVTRLNQPHPGVRRFASFYKRSSHHEEQLKLFLSRHNMSMEDVVPESSLLKYCLVAEGKYAYAGGWSSLESWDIAAADLVVHEAGGKMICADNGQGFYYRTDQSRVDAPLAVARGMDLHLSGR